MAPLLSGEINPEHMLTIAALAGVSVLARCFFFLTSKPWVLPGWAQRGLQYAPIAALCAVIAPEILMTHGQLIHTLKDARLYGLCAGVLYYFLRRASGQSVLGTIVAGMAVYLPLHISLGW